ncbi:glutathione synthase [Sporothrix schenckii 1099-18]|uniref:Glutathione synthetase n=2 Tax=Sporothrix schenckii TaxID=29908 RepID=U7PNH1_SPOS1|nr:glutathione synthase [Sporothrix schenckii 1099-18]ERS97188.1 glutathione synthetase [Sporothrix schenckii ATCC 58251]KJR86406.1 glutathione synthase [Sporothrix schenckii 1099-18]
MAISGPDAGAAYPPAVDVAEQQRLVQVIKDWSIANGLAVRPPPAAISATEAALASTLAMTAPVTLFPSPFARSCFEEAQAAQQAYNELYAKISQDEAFLGRIVAEVAGGDEFTTKLWAVHERVKKEGYTHKHSLGIFRSDYLVHQETAGDTATGKAEAHLQIKQVEFNTIAASFGGLSGQASRLHKFLAKTEYPLLKANTPRDKYSLPDNTSSRDIAAGLQAAFEVYERSEPKTSGTPPRCVIFLTQDGERNVFDQRHIEYAVEAPVFRVPFSAILQQTSVDTSVPRRPLLYRHAATQTFEVAVVYMRAGYGPSDYPDESAWEARYQVERSAAIKCPTVLTQVAGTKKVQQVLATPSASADGAPSELGRFVADADRQATLRRTFANIYPLDTDSAAGRQARVWAQDAAACRKFVLKPQREGGGNNYYKDKIPAHLQTVPAEHWASYILMELITPPPVANLILRNGQVEQGGVICELGIYGTCIWGSESGSASQSILRNETAGYLLRTKGDQSEEGGVAAGFGCMDSVNLV